MLTRWTRHVVWAVEDAPRWERLTTAALCCLVAAGEALLGGAAWAWAVANLAAAGGLLWVDHRAAARARDLESLLRTVLRRTDAGDRDDRGERAA